MLEWVDFDGVPECLSLSPEETVAVESICYAPTWDGGTIWATVMGQGTPGLPWVVRVDYEPSEAHPRAYGDSARAPSLEEILEALQFVGTPGALFSFLPIVVQGDGVPVVEWLDGPRVRLRQVAAAMGSQAGTRWALGGGTGLEGFRGGVVQS